MQIQEKNPRDLKPYHANNKKHSPEQIAHIANSIERYGFVQPVVLQEDGTIIIGHARREAAIRLKLKSIPTVTLKITEEQAQRLRLLDNRLGDLGEYDIDAVLSEIEDLGDDDLREFFKDLYPEEEEEYEERGEWDGKPKETLQDIVLVVTKEQRETIRKALAEAKKIPHTDSENFNANGNALFILAREYITQ